MSASKQQHQRPVIFQHIPKTAGVSVRSVMSCNFHLNEILHVPDRLWKDADFAADSAKQYRFIHGHLHFEFVRNLLSSARVVTFLRDPVERVLSLYFFLRKQDPDSQSDPSARFTVEEARSLSLEAFVAHTDRVIASMVGNFQVRILLSDSQRDKSNSTWVAAALANLQKYQFVGIADPDLMSDSILVMSRIFGWLERGDSPRVNHTARSATKADLTCARKIILERNKLDIALHDQVRENFQGNIAPKGKSTGRRRAATQVQRKLYSTGLTSPVTMDQPLRCWGWHDRESDPDNDNWRCAAQLRAGLELKVAPDPVLIVLFQLRSVHPRISVSDTVIEAQDSIVHSREFLVSNRWVIAAVVERKDIGDDDILSLQIVCKEVEEPESVTSQTPDNRFVTFGLRSIEVLTVKAVGLTPFEFLVHAIREPHAHLEQLQATVRAIDLERSARRTEQSAAAREFAALTERAQRAETYSESLSAELKKKKGEIGALQATREQDRVEAEKQYVALTERAKRAETYIESLSAELKNQRAEIQALLAARQQTQVEADKYHSALLERAQRAETYSNSLSAELEKRRVEAEKHSAALLERAHRSEMYSESLTDELKKQQEQYQVLLAARERERVELSIAASNDRAAMVRHQPPAREPELREASETLQLPRKSLRGEAAVLGPDLVVGGRRENE
jgi:hypothetical protein